MNSIKKPSLQKNPQFIGFQQINQVNTPNSKK